jgi:hypothetical protein
MVMPTNPAAPKAASVSKKPKRKKAITDYADRGKWAEAEAMEWLEGMASKHKRFAFHRYPDARAARGALSPQPADFLVAYRWGTAYTQGAGRIAWHLEVKETAEKYRLPSDKVSQYGKLKMFYWAGIRCSVLVYRSHHKDWTVFMDYDILEHEDMPASFVFNNRSYPDKDTALMAILKELVEKP